MNRNKGANKTKKVGLKTGSRTRLTPRLVLSTIPPKTTQSIPLKQLMMKIRTPALNKIRSARDIEEIKILITNDSLSTKGSSKKQGKKKVVSGIRMLNFSPIKTRKVQENDQCLADVFSMLNTHRGLNQL